MRPLFLSIEVLFVGAELSVVEDVPLYSLYLTLIKVFFVAHPHATNMNEINIWLTTAGAISNPVARFYASHSAEAVFCGTQVPLARWYLFFSLRWHDLDGGINLIKQSSVAL